MRMFVKKSLTRNHESRRAEAALLRVVINESLLHRMQLFAVHQSFDGCNSLALRLERQYRARVNGFAVHDDSAGTTARSIAHTFRSGQFQFVTKRVEQSHARLNFG